MLAITSLGYTAWRNETSEIQRNHREAAFRIMIEIGELREVILTRRYFVEPNEPDATDRIERSDNWVAGWAKATMVRDLASLLPPPMPAQGEALFQTWSEQAGDLDAPERSDRDAASNALLADLDTLRSSTVAVVQQLR